MTNRTWFQKFWPPTAAILLLLVVWQLAVTIWAVPAWMLPSPLQIVSEGISSMPRMWMHTAFTIRMTLIGYAIGAVVGFVLSFVLHMLPRIKTAFYPLLILSQNIPIIALAPLLMIWFGFGLLPKMIVITLVCFFPIAVATLDGFAQTDPVMMNYMKMIGASRRQIFFKLELPHAIPYLFSGLKISATYSVMGAVISEWLGSDKGIGVYMLLAKSGFRTDRVFVAIFIIVFLSLLLFGCIILLERVCTRWKPKV
ncbi:ABC transporter permease [Brevibacillus massiliensis]|jgi:ABC-type nitrate/sulfonate/bicarbonate transport system permease component|uniref:ABC transporter permease n=1 Tax=Brevibacillus massiliensis TaxID=1118054 RepID=UPI000377791D|nr:ABC transporter permease [Brevibacillus massiliensis]